MPVKSKESVGPCEISLDIEVESNKVAEAVDKAYREFSKYVAVPGFRKGKAPMSFVKQRVPAEQVRERTAEILAGPAFQEAVKENDIQPYAQPRMEMVKLETTPPDYVFEFKAIVPLAPKVTVGEYKGLKVEREIRAVTDKDVEDRLKYLQERATEYPLVEGRPAASPDVVSGDLAVTPEDGISTDGDPSARADGEFHSTAIQLGDPGNVKGVDEQLSGMNRGETKEFDLTYPIDYPSEDVAGKSAHFVFKLREIHSKIVPELDDEFAKKVAGLDTLDALKARVREDMEATHKEFADTGVQNKLIDQIVASSTIDYPSVLVDVEMEDDIKQFRADLDRRDVSIEDYFEQSGQTQEELLGNFRGRAELRLRRGLALGEISKAESLQITDEDITKEIQLRADQNGTTLPAMRAVIERTKAMQDVRNTSYTKKVLGHVMSLAKITDKIVQPDPEPETETPAAPKKAKTPKAAASAEVAETTEPAKPKKVKAKKAEAAE